MKLLRQRRWRLGGKLATRALDFPAVIRKRDMSGRPQTTARSARDGAWEEFDPAVAGSKSAGAPPVTHMTQRDAPAMEGALCARV